MNHLLVEIRWILPYSGKISKLCSKLLTIIVKAGNSSTIKHIKERLNMNAMLIIKYSSNVMQGKRKLCECENRYMFTFFSIILPLQELLVLKLLWKPFYDYVIHFMLFITMYTLCQHYIKRE